MRDYEQFIAVLRRNLRPEQRPFDTVFARYFADYANRAHRLNETACNRELSAREEARQRHEDQEFCFIVRQLGFVPIVNGDPRGAAAKIQFPDGTTNDFCSDAYCVPTSRH